MLLAQSIYRQFFEIHKVDMLLILGNVPNIRQKRVMPGK
jgi:hypothetical protein